jgi:hypothetical protein
VIEPGSSGFGPTTTWKKLLTLCEISTSLSCYPFPVTKYGSQKEASTQNIGNFYKIRNVDMPTMGLHVKSDVLPTIQQGRHRHLEFAISLPFVYFL